MAGPRHKTKPPSIGIRFAFDGLDSLCVHLSHLAPRLLLQCLCFPWLFLCAPDFHLARVIRWGPHLSDSTLRSRCSFKMCPKEESLAWDTCQLHSVRVHIPTSVRFSRQRFLDRPQCSQTRTKQIEVYGVLSPRVSHSGRLFGSYFQVFKAPLTNQNGI